MSSFLLNALEIKSQRNDHLYVEDPLAFPHPQMWCRVKPRSASAPEVWERSGQSCGPRAGVLTCPGLEPSPCEVGDSRHIITLLLWQLPCTTTGGNDSPNTCSFLFFPLSYIYSQPLSDSYF